MNPLEYYVDITTKLQRGFKSNRLDELPPWNWRPQETSKHQTAPPKIVKRLSGAEVIELVGFRHRVRQAGQYSAASAEPS